MILKIERIDGKAQTREEQIISLIRPWRESIKGRFVKKKNRVGSLLMALRTESRSSLPIPNAYIEICFFLLSSVTLICLRMHQPVTSSSRIVSEGLCDWLHCHSESQLLTVSYNCFLLNTDEETKSRNYYSGKMSSEDALALRNNLIPLSLLSLGFYAAIVALIVNKRLP